MARKKTDKPVEKKNPGGRPLEYTKEMGDYICELVATTEFGLKKLTQLHPELPDKVTINRWRHRVEGFRIQYAMAKIEQADLLAEEIIEIADDASNDWMESIEEDGSLGWKLNGEHINRSRLRIDTRKWLASKLLPKQYGDRKAEEPMSNDETLAKIKAVVDGLNKINPSDV